MDLGSVKPPTKNFSGIVHALTKVLRLRASGIAPIDGVKRIKLPENCVDSAQKMCRSQTLRDDDDDQEKEKKLRNREVMEVLLAQLFASISAIKAAYAQLQIAQTPYDPDCIQSADEVVVAELKTLSELKHCYLKKQILPSRDFQLSAEIREQQNLLKTYDIMVKKLKSQLLLKDSEMLFLKEKLLDSDQQNKLLEKRLNVNPQSPLSALDNLHFSALNPTHFITFHHHTLKSIRSFVKLVIDEMEYASWDIDAAAYSIEPNTVFARPSHRSLAFESYVCRKMFAGFQDPNFMVSSESSGASKQRRRQQHYFNSFMDLKSRKVAEILRENPESELGKFCRLKYLSVVHPKMEASFFGDHSQSSLLSSGAFPDTSFFWSFAEMARRVWCLQRLGFSFEAEAAIFQVRKGCCFSEVYMQSAAEGACESPDVRPRVAFTVVPGFRVGKSVVQCRVYLSPA